MDFSFDFQAVLDKSEWHGAAMFLRVDIRNPKKKKYYLFLNRAMKALIPGLAFFKWLLISLINPNI